MDLYSSYLKTWLIHIMTTKITVAARPATNLLSNVLFWKYLNEYCVCAQLLSRIYGF